MHAAHAFMYTHAQMHPRACAPPHAHTHTHSRTHPATTATHSPARAPARPHRAVGMEISVGLLAARFRTVLAAMALLILGKVAVMGAVGQAFGLTLLQASAGCVCGGKRAAGAPQGLRRCFGA